MQDVEAKQIITDELEKMKYLKNDFSMLFFAVMLLYVEVMTLLDARGLNVAWPVAYSAYSAGVARDGLSLLCLMATLVFIVEISRPHISNGIPLLHVPASLFYQVAGFSLLACMSILTSDSYWLIIGRTVLFLIGVFMAIAQYSRRRYQKWLQKQLEVIVQRTQKQGTSLLVQVPRCSLCKQESQYEICLDCERLFQGERQRVRSQIMRAKQAGTPATLTLQEWLETLAIFHGRCAYCHGPYQVLEHYIPIVAGGGTTKENCVPACISCNSKKSGKHPEKDLTWEDILPKITPKPKGK
jgi:5-methylcytosine-specific restriction endonuclease McrA